MSVLLTTSAACAADTAHEYWLATTDSAPPPLPPATRLPQLARRLEQAFEAMRDHWWAMARSRADETDADLSHTMACGAFGSDFGLMLAWTHLAAELAAQPTTTLMVCDDPWLFRQLMGIAGLRSLCPPPPLAVREWKMRLRGLAARSVLALRLVRACLATRRWRGHISPGEPVLLVYGHPSSRADGFDAYFGELMRHEPGVKRLLHTDCPPERAATLAADGRSAALHGWGSWLFALTMPLWRWRPSFTEPFAWLIRRAELRENSGGGPAMNRWQMHCQRRFLVAIDPRTICWPWENHAWERDLCRAARILGIPTIGYQHTVVGPHQINYSPRANADGAASLPDLVATDGPAYLAELRDWDVPADRLLMAGAWRFTSLEGRPYDPTAPVFVPLSAIPAIARLQVEAAGRLAAAGRHVLVKEHPMYPLSFSETDRLRRTEQGISVQPRLSAVLYATGTSGLEGLLLGLPTFRLMGQDRLSINVLPADIQAPAITIDEVVDVLADPPPPIPLDFERVLGKVDMQVWKTLLNGAMHP